MFGWERNLPAAEVIAYRRNIVVDFLMRCNEYADDKLLDYGARLPAERDVGELALKMLQWSSYKSFNAHAIGEIERGELDHWFGVAEGTADRSRDD